MTKLHLLKTIPVFILLVLAGCSSSNVENDLGAAQGEPNEPGNQYEVPIHPGNSPVNQPPSPNNR